MARRLNNQGIQKRLGGFNWFLCLSQSIFFAEELASEALALCCKQDGSAPPNKICLAVFCQFSSLNSLVLMIMDGKRKSPEANFKCKEQFKEIHGDTPTFSIFSGDRLCPRKVMQLDYVHKKSHYRVIPPS